MPDGPAVSPDDARSTPPASPVAGDGTEGEGRGQLTLTLYMMIIAIAMIQGSLGAMLPLIGLDLPMSHTVESLHITALATGALLASSIVEFARLRLGRWRLLMASAIVGILGAAALSAAPSTTVTIAAVVVVGVSVALFMITAQTLLVARHPGRGARFIGELNVSFSIGAVGAAIVLPIVVSVWGWRMFPLLQAVLILLCVPVLLRARAEATGIPEHTPPEVTRTARAARRPVLAIVGLCMFVAAEWSLVFWLPIYLTSELGLSGIIAARLAAIMLGAVLVGRAAGAALLNRFSPTMVLAGSLVASAAAVGLLRVADTLTVATLVSILIGIAVANLYPAGIALVVAAYPAGTDRAISRASISQSITVIAFPIVLGALADAVGLTTAFLIVPVVAAAGLIVLRSVGLPAAAPRIPTT